ncbi:hypothetical protein ACHQM5_002264 [Ranunculus cassubicifolius]
MAPSPEIIDISSDEEDDHSCLKRCVKKERNRSPIARKENLDSDDDDDCVILDDDPENSVRRFESRNGGSDELLIVAEKGQVACRDYPHARHLCARYPFNTNPHDKYCDMCHCYVCDTHAPCMYWGTGKSRDDHCHSTDKEEIWRLLRECSKQGTLEGELESTRVANTISSAAPIRPEQSPSQPVTINEHNVVLLGLTRLSGIVKWFNGTRGYGFIIPDSGEEDVFVHQSSIKARGFRKLAEGEAVEFDVGHREDGRRAAINVTGPGGTFVRGTTVRTVSPSVVGVCNGCYNCGEVGHFMRNCSYTNDPKTSDTTECDNLDHDVANAEMLTGIVKWYNKQRGIGFITLDNGGKDIFVRKSSINKGYKTLTEGEEVEFHVGSGEDGRRMAIDVGEVKNAYYLATNDEEQTSSEQRLNSTLEKVRKLKLPPHIKLFLWKLIKDGLPIATGLKHFEGKGHLSCPWCGVNEENEVHIFFSCPWARRIWHASFLGIHTDCHGSWDLQEWGTHIVSWMWVNRRIGNRALHYIPFLLHHMWKAGNGTKFEHKPTKAEVVLANSVSEWMNWNEHLGIGRNRHDPPDHPNSQHRISGPT